MAAAIAAYPASGSAALQPWRPNAAAAASRHCRRRRSIAVRAGLLDLFGGGSSAPQLPRDEDGEELRAWLEQRGLPPQQLAAVAVPGAGRGLAATQPIAKGEALLRLPLELVLTPAAAQQRSCLRPLLEEAEAAGRPLPAWSVLALFLAEARAAGPDGEWWPYLRLLPQQTGCVLEWSEEEVGWLRGSQLHEAAQEIRAAADASWQEMQPLLAEAAQRGIVPPGAFDRASLQWAFGMLLSRLVRLASLGGSGSGSDSSGTSSGTSPSSSTGSIAEPPGTEALLPWADLLNHSPTCTNHLDWSAADAAVVLRADRKYKGGEEVHVSYGEKTGGDLLLSYGFAPPPATNPHDGVKLRLSLREDDPAHAWKAAALARHGFAPSQLFPLRMQAAPWELMHFAGICVAQVGKRAAEVDSLAGRLFQQDDFPRELQPVALEAVIRACQEAQQAYPSSLDADRAELEALLEQQRAAGAGGSSAAAPSRRQQVLQVLIYERQVLVRTIFILQQELRDLKRMARA